METSTQDMETWRNGDLAMETCIWRHGHGRHGHGRHGDMDMENMETWTLKQNQSENGSTGDFPQSVCGMLTMHMEVCLFVCFLTKKQKESICKWNK